MIIFLLGFPKILLHRVTHQFVLFGFHWAKLEPTPKKEKALPLLSDLEKEESNASRVHYFKGLCHIGLGNTERAAAFVSKAVELNPGYLKARLLLADIYLHQRSFELAVNQAVSPTTLFMIDR